MQPGSPHSHQLPMVVCPASATVEKAIGPVSLWFSEGENRSGIAKMQTAANTNRIFTDCSSKVEFSGSEILVTGGGLLQHIFARHLAQALHSRESFVKLTDELIRVAEEAYLMRDVDSLDDVSQVLMSLPVEGAREIGTYYYALAINRRGRRDDAELLFEQVADSGPITCRSRALQTLGGNRRDCGQLDEAVRFQLEAYRMASDRNANGLQTRMLALWEISIARGVDGDHKGALSDLKNLRPIVDLIAKQKPFYFYAYCNALAVELGELGRAAEATAAISIALSSPYASAYPNWAETRLEIESRNTSAPPAVVAVNRPAEVRPETQPNAQRKPEIAPVLILGALVNHYAFIKRSTNEFPAKTTIVLNAVSILDRMLICIGPRAPPVRS